MSINAVSIPSTFMYKSEHYVTLKFYFSTLMLPYISKPYILMSFRIKNL
jgi:hypothetical protein